jgi:hypothetical protein
VKSYLCNRLSDSGHIHESEKFDALDDVKACEIAAEFSACGDWLDYEVWQGERLVRSMRRERQMKATGVLAELVQGQ